MIPSDSRPHERPSGYDRRVIGFPLTEGLYETVLRTPAEAADTLHVLSGYATPAFLNRLVEDLRAAGLQGRKIDLVVGMSGVDGVNKAHHEGFIQAVREHAEDVSVSYVPRGNSNHSKLYVWTLDGTPQCAFGGSSNFTLNGFMMNARRPLHREILFGVDHFTALQYFHESAQFTIAAQDPALEEHVDITAALRHPMPRAPHDPTASGAQIATPPMAPTATLPLIIVAADPKQGQVHDKWGLNWGQRPGRNRNQATIPYPMKAKSQTPGGFFPIGPAGRREQFTVLTDDGKAIEMIVAEENDKALHSRPRNDLIGSYFRERLRLPSGARVEVDDLNRAGSRYVRFTKIDDETFFMEYNPSVDAEGRRIYGV